MSTDLFLHRLTLHRRAFFRLGATSTRATDRSYALHASLAALFAKSSEPSSVPFTTFAVDDDRERQMSWGQREELLPLLAYAPCPAEALELAPVPSDAIDREGHEVQLSSSREPDCSHPT